LFQYSMAFLIVALNLLHFYIMVYMSEQWAHWNYFLLLNTAIHIAQGALAIILLFDLQAFDETYDCLRLFVLICSYFQMALYLLTLGVEIYLLNFTSEWFLQIAAAYVAYFLLINATMLPQCTYILIYQSGESFNLDKPEERNGVRVFEIQ